MPTEDQREKYNLKTKVMKYIQTEDLRNACKLKK